jgi:hypothetical protein
MTAKEARPVTEPVQEIRPADSSGSPQPSQDPSLASLIGGLSVLKGLVLYGATLTFAGFYSYFMFRIFDASGNKPTLDTAMVGAAAALAGVLGSAFALAFGTPSQGTNQELFDHLAKAKDGRAHKSAALLRRILSFEAKDTSSASWPLTFGIWMYAAIATAVGITYFVQPAETPDMIRALAIAFSGYVIAFVTAAYGIGAKKAGSG